MSRSGTRIPPSRRRELGQVSLSMWLSPEAAAALSKLVARWETTRTGAVERAIEESAKRRR